MDVKILYESPLGAHNLFSNVHDEAKRSFTRYSIEIKKKKLNRSELNQIKQQIALNQLPTKR